MSVGASGQKMGFIDHTTCASSRQTNRREREHLANHQQRWNFEGSRPSLFPHHFDPRSSCGRVTPSWRRDPGRTSPYSRSARHDYCLYRRPERRKQTCLASRERDQGSCPPLLPSFGSSEPYYFGSGFCKESDESIGQGSSLEFQCIDDGDTPPADRASRESRVYARPRTLKRSGVEEASCLTPSRERVPTLVEMHKAVIDSTLKEFFRPREGPFENLGERLGGGRENFTYCDRSVRMPRGSHSVTFGEIEQCPMFHEMSKTGTRGDDPTTSDISTCCERTADRERRLFRCIHMGRFEPSKPRGLLSRPQKIRSHMTNDDHSDMNQTECRVDEFESGEEFSQGEESHQAKQQPPPPLVGTCHVASPAVHCTTSRKVQKRCDASEPILSSDKLRRLRSAARYSEISSSHFSPVDRPLPSERLRNPSCTFMRSQIIDTTSTAVRRKKKQSSSGRAETKAPTQHKQPRASMGSSKGPQRTLPRRHSNDQARPGKRAPDLRSTKDSHPPSLKLPIDLDRNNGAAVLGEAPDAESISDGPRSDLRTVVVDKGVHEEVDQDAIVLPTEALAATSRTLVEDCVSHVLSCSASWSLPMMAFRSMKQDRIARTGRGADAVSSQMTSSGCFGGSTVRVLEPSNPSSVEVESFPAHEEKTVSSGFFAAEESLGSGASHALSATTTAAASKGPFGTSLSDERRHPARFERSVAVHHVATRVIVESIQIATALAAKEVHHPPPRDSNKAASKA